MRYFLIAIFFVAAQVQATTLDDTAQSYVKLVLALGEHDDHYVDAYYGPSQWPEEVKQQALDLTAIADQAKTLLEQLPTAQQTDAALSLRVDYLRGQLKSLQAYATQLQSATTPSFDQQALALYDTAPPVTDYSQYDSVLLQLSALLPGSEPLHQRVDSFYQNYEIPRNKQQAVFEAAIAECKRRTNEHINLPDGEQFTLEYVTDKPWSGYNWYQGKAQSLIQINVTLPIRIDRAVDLGCHEGYPGHHTYNALLETELVDGRGWVEFSVYPLFSPQSLIAEGSANYGIELAFPGDEKLTFERDVLYPLAGLNPDTAATFQQVDALVSQLSFARNQTARLYIDGDIDREQAIALSQKYGLLSRERAEQSVSFSETYGAYVINYNWGKKLVADYIERNTASPAQRWQKFRQLLASPRLPSGLGG